MCEFYDVCPSKTGWCVNHQPSEECVPFILTAYERARMNFLDKMKEVKRNDSEQI